MDRPRTPSLEELRERPNEPSAPDRPELELRGVEYDRIDGLLDELPEDEPRERDSDPL